jgi:hypothetical protein
VTLVQRLFQQLISYFTKTKDTLHSLALAPLLINWLSPGGMFIGSRRMYLSVQVSSNLALCTIIVWMVTPILQVDGLFLPSSLWDLNSHKNDGSLSYRTTPSDLDHLNEYAHFGAAIELTFAFFFPGS